MAGVVYGGVLPRAFGRVKAWGRPDAAWTDAVYVMAVLLVLAIPSLPFTWWDKFRLEARFGFNRASVGLWVADTLKGAAVALGLGGPLLWALFALVRVAGPLWWVWAFGLFTSFQLAMLILYPRFLLPLFNKLSPLPEGDLRQRLLALAERTGFRTAAIQVMDGSRRSGTFQRLLHGLRPLPPDRAV